MSRSVAPLENLCLHKISGTLSELMHVYRLGLPVRVRNSVLNTFNSNREYKFKESLHCYETPDWLDTDVNSPHTKEFLDSMREHCLDMWDWSTPTPLPADIYAFLMQLPNNFVSFFLEDPTHFVSRRFIKTPPDAPEYCLCEPCFNRDADYDRAVYTVEKTHSIWKLNDAFSYIKDPWNWCANCVTTPLFKILSEEMCRNENNLHKRRRSSQMFWRFENYSTDDDSDSDEFISFRIQHPRLAEPL